MSQIGSWIYNGFKSINETIKSLNHNVKSIVSNRYLSSYHINIRGLYDVPYPSKILHAPNGDVIYHNQVAAAHRIINHLKDTSGRSVILQSEMQVGKTGVAVYIAMEAKELLKINKILFICGMSDNSLKQQTIKRFSGLSTPFEVLFNTDLQKQIKNKTKYHDEKLLVIFDESHYGSGRNQVVHKFLIDNLGMDPSRHYFKWRNKESYLVSISATPFTEQASNKLFKSGKTIFKLENGCNYKGLQYLMSGGYIKQSYKLTNDNDFQKLIDDLKFDQNGYYIVRINSDNVANKCQQYIQQTLGFDDTQFVNKSYKTELGSTNINQILMHKSDKPVIVWIYGSLSAGYTVNLNHTVALFESPSNQIETNVQRLPGRACGYYTHQPPLIYTSISDVEQYIKYLECGQFPDTCKYVNNQGKGNYIGAPNVPFKINIKDHMKNLNPLIGKPIKLKNMLIKDIIPEIITKRGLSDEQLKILSSFNYIGASTTYNPNNKKKQQLDIVKRWHEAHKKWMENKVYYGNDKGKKSCPSNQYYVYLNSDPNDYYYGDLMITSFENCEKKTDKLSISIETMYHINNSWSVKIAINLKNKLIEEKDILIGPDINGQAIKEIKVDVNGNMIEVKMPEPDKPTKMIIKMKPNVPKPKIVIKMKINPLKPKIKIMMK